MEREWSRCIKMYACLSKHGRYSNAFSREVDQGMHARVTLGGMYPIDSWGMQLEDGRIRYVCILKTTGKANKDACSSMHRR
jgi:hypothetical protein